MAGKATDTRMRPRRTAVAAAVTFIATTCIAAAMPGAAHAGSAAVTCTYTFNAWNGGFSANVHIANNGPTINGWSVRWTFAESTDQIQAWSSLISVRDGVEVTATNASYNAVIPSGGAVDFGWNARSAATSTPTDLTINGAAC